MSCIGKYLVFFRENRISITATTGEKKALQNPRYANIILDELNHEIKIKLKLRKSEKGPTNTCMIN